MEAVKELGASFFNWLVGDIGCDFGDETTSCGSFCCGCERGVVIQQNEVLA
jgi:hypothetical protein